MIKYLFFALLLFNSCKSKSAETYLLEAEELEQKEKYSEAISLLDKAIEKDSLYLGAYLNRGADKSALSNLKDAIKDYEKVVEIDPENTLALYNLGNNYKRLEKYEKAIEYYNKAFRSKGVVYLEFTNNEFNTDPFDVSDYEINYERGIAYYRVDSLQKALNDFKISIDAGYFPGECYSWIGYIYLASGNKDFACGNFQRALQLGDKEAEADIQKYCN